MIDEQKNGAEAPAPHRAQELPGLGAGQHDGQRLIAPDGELLPEHPLEAGAVTEKHPQGHERLIEGGGAQLLNIPQVDEVVEDLALLDPAKLAPGVVRGNLAHLAQILGFAAPPQRF